MKIKKLNISFIKNNFKLFGIIAASITLPILVSLIFFYGNLHLNNLLASIVFWDTNDVEIIENQDKQENSDFKLRLVSQEEFLKKYNPGPAILPKPIQLNATLSGFLRSNSSLELLPARNWAIPFEDINAASAIAVEMPSGRILYGKNIFEIRPIASITKLTIALTAYEALNLDEVVTLSQETIQTEGAAGGLVAGEALTVEQLLYALLLESSNDAAVALETYYNEQREEGLPDFMALVNQKVRELGISDTFFEEPVGLSPANTSSASSVVRILYEVSQNKKLASIMATASYATEAQNKNIAHYWINLNTLLEAYDGVIGGKTGYTEEAGPSMVIISKTPNKDKYLVISVLNAVDRVEETTRLLKWVKKAYIWEE